MVVPDVVGEDVPDVVCDDDLELVPVDVMVVVPEDVSVKVSDVVGVELSDVLTVVNGVVVPVVVVEMHSRKKFPSPCALNPEGQDDTHLPWCKYARFLQILQATSDAHS